MASMIKLLRASSLDGLERTINDFFADTAKDARVEVDLAGGITFANDEYIAPVRVSAPHKRSFTAGGGESE